MPLVTALVALALWILLAARNSPHVLPGPNLVWSAFQTSWAQDQFQPAFVTTLVEATTGWAIGAAAGLVLGYLISRSRLLEYAVTPYLAGAQAAPMIAVAPLLLLWLGLGMQLKIWLAAVIALFPVMTTTISGIRAVKRDYVDVARVFGASWWQQALHVEGPLSARSIFAGARIAIVLAVVGAFVGELVNPDQGLYAYIQLQNQSFDTAGVFVGVLALMALAAFLFAVLIAIERMTIRWME